MSQRTMIKTRILILSDTHAALPLPADNDRETQVPFHRPLPSADVLLHCGDLTMTGSIPEHENAVQLITSVDAPVKVVIPGNHDLTLDRTYYDKFPTEHATFEQYSPETLDMVRQMYDSAQAREQGIRYLEEGVGRFTLKNGASLNVYASAYQLDFGNWAFNYPRHVDRFNPRSRPEGPEPENPVPAFNPHYDGKDHDEGGIDIMITHGPPKGILDGAVVSTPDGTVESEPVGCEHLRRAVERCRPRVHAFGHIHEAWGAVRMRWDVDGDQAHSEGHARQKRDSHDSESRETTCQSQFHPTHNPTTTYSYTDASSSLSGSPVAPERGGTLVALPPYATQTDDMSVSIDATDLDFGKETVFVNASIMNLHYRPVNTPWVVDVLLPAAREGARNAT